MVMNGKHALVAGATGYLGRYIAQQLVESGYTVRVIVRKRQRAGYDAHLFDIVEAQVTQPASLAGVMDGIDVVISTVGITRQKDGLTYMDVDYQANRNLLSEAQRAGVGKFIYVSAFNGDKLRHLKIFEAKERFVDELKASGMEYTVMRPNGFFSDMGDFLTMAKGGRVYLFGSGNFRLNPIHGADLAEVCVAAINSAEKEVAVGGPDIFSQNDIAVLALRAWSKKVKISHLPDWIRRMIIWFMRTFTSSKTYGPIEFFLTTMAMEFVTPTYGKHRLEIFFAEKVAEGKGQQ